MQCYECYTASWAQGDGDKNFVNVRRPSLWHARRWGCAPMPQLLYASNSLLAVHCRVLITAPCWLSNGAMRLQDRKASASICATRRISNIFNRSNVDYSWIKRANWEEAILLINELDPEIICLQETMIGQGRCPLPDRFYTCPHNPSQQVLGFSVVCAFTIVSGCPT
ncbi:hypothetical protein GWK47_020534 [Chionoecetes opilio]|uniref:Endonuclease/exonuclease/phosphatase domain-containing protein n=1 Tax=Chionoecetes opilio TaxID=41210 RepID=A0A8J4XQ33_CHIOP|nr:hypothetical protein GWK47_020534 [Chionoecetes opilio]